MMMGEMKPGKQYVRGYPELFGEFSLPKVKELLLSMPGSVIPAWAAENTGRNGRPG
jgi:hypothetical protein